MSKQPIFTVRIWPDPSNRGFPIFNNTDVIRIGYFKLQKLQQIETLK